MDSNTAPGRGQAPQVGPSGKPLWERQPWETPTAYDRFLRFYLAQDEPRSVDAAFREWYTQAHGLDSGDEQVKRKSAPGTWRNWSLGRKWNGQPKAESWPWRDRADAYNAHVAELFRLQQQKRQLEVLESDWQAGGELRNTAKTLTEFLANWKVGTDRKEAVGLKGEQVVTITRTVAPNVTLAHLARALEASSNLQRTAAQVESPTQKHKHELTGAGGGPLHVQAGPDFSGLSDDELDKLIVNLQATTSLGIMGAEPAVTSGQGADTDND